MNTEGRWQLIAVLAIAIVGMTAVSIFAPEATNGLAALGAVVTSVISIFVLQRVEVVHKATNSMTDRLVQVTGDSEYAKGEKAGRAESERERSNE